ncbi:hypothetical protein PG990_008809 [Apiospora arundinis]
MMSCDEVNVKVKDVARLDGLDTLQVVLELIAPTQVGIAVVILVRLLHGVFNGACDVCAGTESAGLKDRLSRFRGLGRARLSRAARLEQIRNVLAALDLSVSIL